MTALHRMLIRDLLHLRGQVIAVTLVVACGAASFVSMRSTYRSLLVSRAEYYERYRFADVFVQVKRAPEAVAGRIGRIPGVAAFRTRIVHDVTLDVPGLAEPAVGRLVSIPERPLPVLNDIHLRQGRYVEPGRRDEVLASEAFTEANHLHPGDRLGAVINGRWQQLVIVGTALSPEYVYEVRGRGSILPDNRRFGVLWMSREALGPAFNMEGAFNDVALRLERSAVKADVIARLDRLLDEYGCLGAYGREDQLSHTFLNDEINQNRVTGVLVPSIFLGVAVFLLHMVLSRLVQTQRAQIALLKAFGYSGVQIGWHYLQLAFLAVAGGILLGTAVGLYYGALLTEVYTRFYRFPVLRYAVNAEILANAVWLSLAAAAAGAIAASRRATALPPAEAMRPEPPGRYRPGLAERFGLRKLVSIGGRMILRNLERRPWKAALSLLGISLASGILIVGRYFFDAFDHMIRVQFETAQRDDVTVFYNEPLASRARHDAGRLPGVLRAEPFREVPVRLRFEHRSRRVAILGLPPGATLRRPVDQKLRTAQIPPDGLLLTRKLADILQVAPGQWVTVEVLEGLRPVRRIPVAGAVDEVLGITGYMDLRALNRLMREGGTTSGAYLAADSAILPRLYALLKRTPAVAGVSLRQVSLQSFVDIIEQSVRISTNVLIAFSCIIAFGMVYNGARIALSERAHELASLRVLGFTQREVAALLLGEQALLTIAAIPAGFVIGRMICELLAQRMESELYRMPVVISARSYGFAAVVVAAAAVFSGLMVLRRVYQLDLVAVLKSRE